jgi:hypothetical protein
MDIRNTIPFHPNTNAQFGYIRPNIDAQDSALDVPISLGDGMEFSQSSGLSVDLGQGLSFRLKDQLALSTAWGRKVDPAGPNNSTYIDRRSSRLAIDAPGIEGDVDLFSRGNRTELYRPGSLTTIEERGSNITIEGPQGLTSIERRGSEITMDSASHSTSIVRRGGKVRIEHDSELIEIQRRGNRLDIISSASEEPTSIQWRGDKIFVNQPGLGRDFSVEHRGGQTRIDGRDPAEISRRGGIVTITPSGTRIES